MLHKSMLLFFMLFSFLIGTAQDLSGKSLKQQLQKNLFLAADQYKLLQQSVPQDRMPRNFDMKTGTLATSDTKWWCSGFFPGTLWYIYKFTKDAEIRKAAEARLAILEKEKHFTGNHDLGFMMFCSFGTAYNITGNDSYKKSVDTAAMSLATRYRPSIKSIQSWDSSKNFRCPVIVDNMMNLELLCWVSDHGGDARFREIAINHANSTIKHHFRPDNAAYHVLDYTLAEGGKLLGNRTWQGAHDTSAWSRGNAWALYGFTMMYRMTQDAQYLEQAKKIAAFLLNHKNMPKDLIPYWDFDAPGIPNAPRDASAASIMASALVELSGFVKGTEKATYLSSAEKMLSALSSPEYFAAPGTNGGFLIKHSVGALPFNAEVDFAITYADYYYVEAALRYLER